MRQLCRPLPHQQSPTTVNTLPRYTTQLAHSKFTMSDTKMSLLHSDLTEHIPLCL